MKIWFQKRLRKKDDIKTNLLRKNTTFLERTHVVILMFQLVQKVKAI